MIIIIYINRIAVAILMKNNKLFNNSNYLMTILIKLIMINNYYQKIKKNLKKMNNIWEVINKHNQISLHHKIKMKLQLIIKLNHHIKRFTLFIN